MTDLITKSRSQVIPMWVSHEINRTDEGESFDGEQEALTFQEVCWWFYWIFGMKIEKLYLAKSTSSSREKAMRNEPEISSQKRLKMP